MQADKKFFEENMTDKQKFDQVMSMIEKWNSGRNDVSKEFKEDIFAKSFALFKGGYTPAIKLLVACYMYGIGVNKDCEKALKLACFGYHKMDKNVFSTNVLAFAALRVAHLNLFSAEEVVYLYKKAGYTEAHFIEFMHDYGQTGYAVDLVQVFREQKGIDEEKFDDKVAKLYQGMLTRKDEHKGSEVTREDVHKILDNANSGNTFASTKKIVKAEQGDKAEQDEDYNNVVFVVTKQGELIKRPKVSAGSGVVLSDVRYKGDTKKDNDATSNINSGEAGDRIDTAINAGKTSERNKDSDSDKGASGGAFAHKGEVGAKAEQEKEKDKSETRKKQKGKNKEQLEKENKGVFIRTKQIKDKDKSKVNTYRIENDPLYKALSSKIKGQDNAIKDIIINKRMVQMGWENASVGPREKYFFYGYTGTGKTSLANELTKAQYGDTKDKMLVLSMENYTSEAGISRLIGASQGYKDSDKGGVLTNALLKDNDIVVVFDEIEKAHDTIIQSLLSLLDRGVIYDGFGNAVDASKATIIFTSNIGTKEVMNAGVPCGSAEEREIFDKAIRDRFSPEFLGRLPSRVLFGRLSKDALKEILYNVIKEMNECNTKGIVITLKDSAVEQMLKEPEVLEKNVRGLKQNIKNKLLKNITINASPSERNKEYEIYYQNGKYCYNEYAIAFDGQCDREL